MQTGTGDDEYAFLNDLLDTIDDFLWMRQVDLRNNEPRPQDGERPDDAVIYGKDYDELKVMLLDVINRWNIV